jgi:UbiD family decarboxylase
MSFPFKDLREFLRFLEEKNDLVRVKVEVDPTWEINGISKKLLDEGGPAVLFEKVKGSNIPLLCNLYGAERRFLWALGMEGTDIRRFNEEWRKRTQKLLEPVMVKSGPCKENIIRGEQVDITKFPIPIWHKQDGGRYIGTLSVCITKDPDTGWRNAGIYRMMIFSRNETGWGAPPYTHGGLHFKKYEERGEPMPMAVVTGYDPVIGIVGATRTPPYVDEFALAGALRGEPVEMVKCETIDLEVPATAEFVFEGEVLPNVRREDGPFGEYTGYYGGKAQVPVFRIKAITHRNNPIYMGAREGWEPSESFYLNGLTSQAEAYKTLKSLVPGIVDFKANVCYEAIVSIKKMYRGHAQQVMDAIWGCTYSKYKHVIVVPHYVDVHDYRQVHWALSTLVKADRDVYIVRRRSGQWLDPAQPRSEKMWQTCMGIDATGPTYEYEAEGEKFPDTVDDPDIKAKVEAQWEKYGLKKK